jgi:hypothetical protein
MSFVDPFKINGWNQGLYEQSSTKKESLGTLRFTKDGRAFRYGKSGEALTAGKGTACAQTTANHIKQTGDAIALGATQVTLLLGATLAAKDAYADGYLQIYDGAATVVGHQYLIESHPAADSAANIYLQLDRPIAAAVISTDTWSLIPNPWSSLTHEASLSHGFGGIPLISVSSGYYAWFQVGGLACMLNIDASALGCSVCVSATEGGFKTVPDGASDAPQIGHVVSFASITAKYCPVLLNAAL